MLWVAKCWQALARLRTGMSSTSAPTTTWPPVCSLSASTTATSGSLTGTAVSGYAVSGGSLSLPENAQVLTAGYYDGYSFLLGGRGLAICGCGFSLRGSGRGVGVTERSADRDAVCGLWEGGVSKLLPCVSYYDEEGEARPLCGADSPWRHPYARFHVFYGGYETFGEAGPAHA